MKDYVYSKTLTGYLKISFRHGLIFPKWIKSLNKLIGIENYTLYSKFHVKKHSIYAYSQRRFLKNENTRISK